MYIYSVNCGCVFFIYFACGGGVNLGVVLLYNTCYRYYSNIHMKSYQSEIYRYSALDIPPRVTSLNEEQPGFNQKVHQMLN